MTFSISQAQRSALRWRRLRQLERIAERARLRTPEETEYCGNSITRIRMVVSPWSRDEQGFPTRTVTAT